MEKELLDLKEEEEDDGGAEPKKKGERKKRTLSKKQKKEDSDDDDEEEDDGKKPKRSKKQTKEGSGEQAHDDSSDSEDAEVPMFVSEAPVLSVAEVRFPNLIAFWQETRNRRHRLRRCPNTNEVRFRPHHLQLQVCARLKTTRAGGGYR